MVPFLASSQSRKTTKPVDSAAYYKQEIRNYILRSRDSVYKTEEYLNLQNKLAQALEGRRNYIGQLVSIELAHADNRRFNDSLSKYGFSKLNSNYIRFGAGMTIKHNRSIYDFFLLIVSAPNKSSKTGEEITTFFQNMLQIDYGFDLLNKEKLRLYPFGGLSLRLPVIRYSKEGQPNPDAGFFTEMITGGSYFSMESFRIGYQLGIGFDYGELSHSTRKKGIIGLKIGTNQPFKKDTYKVGGVPSYDPGLNHGVWVIGLYFKSVRIK